MAVRGRYQEVPTFIRRRQSVPGRSVRRICNFATKAILALDQNRVSDSINSYTTRINPRVALLSKRHAARFGSLRDHRAVEGTIRSRRPMARWACAVD